MGSTPAAPVALTGHLAALEACGLIHLAQFQPELEYLFRHALVQETAYETLVRADRRRLHQLIGEALEDLYSSTLAPAEVAPMLAHHFEAAGDLARALRYATQAGQAASAIYANPEAIDHYGRALRAALALPAESAVIIDLYLRRGRALELNAQDAPALANYRDLEAWGLARGDQRAELAALLATATIYVKPSVEQNLPLGRDLTERALALAHELADPAAEAKALWNQMQYHLDMGQMVEAREAGERGLALARAHGLREQVGYLLTDLLKVYFQLSQAAEAQAAQREAQAIWRELGILNMLADSLATASFTIGIFGKYDLALKRSAEALEVSRSIGNLWNQAYSLYSTDAFHFDRGDLGQALAAGHDCLRLSEQAGFAEGINQTLFDLALIYGYLGDLPRAFELAWRMQRLIEAQAGGQRTSPAAEALLAELHLLAGQPSQAEAVLAAAQISEDDEVMRQWFPLANLFVAQVRAELDLAAGRPERALGWVERALSILRTQGIRLYLVNLMLLRGQALRAAGRPAEAETALAEARAEAEELGSRRILWEISGEQAALAAERGEAEAAQRLRAEAAQVIRALAASLDDEALREAFLARPKVRAALGESSS